MHLFVLGPRTYRKRSKMSSEAEVRRMLEKVRLSFSPSYTRPVSLSLP